MTTPPDPLISVSEAARQLGVHPDTIIRWTTAGVLPELRTPGGHRRYRQSDVTRLATPAPQEA